MSQWEHFVKQSETEYCIHCDNPTGRAGKCDDSMYVGNIGPLCEHCFDFAERIVKETGLNPEQITNSGPRTLGDYCGVDDNGKAVN